MPPHVLATRKRQSPDDFEEAPTIKSHVFDDDLRAYYDAYVHGDLASVKSFVKLGFNPQSAVSNVCKAGSVETLQFLGEAGADLRYDDDWPLQLACKHGHIKLVQELVQNQRANVHANFNAPLRRAIESGVLDIVKFLVEHGAHDNMALDHACWFEELHIARYFVSFEEFKTQEVSTFTVLYLCEKNALETVKFLVSIGAKLSAKPIVEENKVLIPNGLGRTTPAQLLRKCVLVANLEMYDCLLQLVCD